MTEQKMTPHQAVAHMQDLLILVPANEWLSANDRMHWRPKAQRTRALRHRAKTLARQQGLMVLTPTLCVARIHYPTARKADPANASPTVKALIDGITDAGALVDEAGAAVDDDSEHLIGPHFTRGPKTGERGLYMVVLGFTPQQVPF